ncbi:MAG: type II toxin-antitoxin system RelE/ParE family toxin, partial [Ruminococcus sp.]|nr:type II toxin-antitoxin system RelE/ParE family toxin [Ruminococcus sp.]
SDECMTNVEYRFVVFEKRYMLLFQIQDDTVYIDYILDCRQDYWWLLP